jgi:hypothetical protein
MEINLSGIPALQDKQSARSFTVNKQALINNRERINDKIRLDA